MPTLQEFRKVQVSVGEDINYCSFTDLHVVATFKAGSEVQTSEPNTCMNHHVRLNHVKTG